MLSMAERVRVSGGRRGILEVATALFADAGVRGTSLQQIADAAGVTKAAVYHHFRTKDEIVRAVLAPAMDRFRDIVRVAAAYRTPEARIEAAVVGLADQAVEHRALWSVVLRDGVAAEMLREDPEHGEVMRALHAVLSAGRTTPEHTVAVAVFLSGLVGPPLDPASAAMAPDVLRAAIADAGRRLLVTG